MFAGALQWSFLAWRRPLRKTPPQEDVSWAPFPEPFGSTTAQINMTLSIEEKAAKFQKLCDIKRALEADMKKHGEDTPEGAELLRQFLDPTGELGTLELQKELQNYMDNEGVGAYFPPQQGAEAARFRPLAAS